MENGTDRKSNVLQSARFYSNGGEVEFFSGAAAGDNFFSGQNSTHLVNLLELANQIIVVINRCCLTTRAQIIL
jgi:hypothetical protein